MQQLPDALRGRLEAVLGFPIDHWDVVRRGYTSTIRLLVKGQGRSAFVKIGATPITAAMVNREIEIYRSVKAPFMPEFLGAENDPHQPILAIEDLSTAQWPPPWTPVALRMVLDQIGAMHSVDSPLDPRPFLSGAREAGWPMVAEDPRPFLALGHVSADWLDASLPDLIAAEAECEQGGRSMTHLDLRSDNICIHDGVVKLVDWAEAGSGNAQVDLGFFLPSLAFEGGPDPDAILPDAPFVAALVSGYFAARAGLPSIPEAPLVRQVQQQQLTTALPWVQRALQLRLLQ